MYLLLSDIITSDEDYSLLVISEQFLNAITAILLENDGQLSHLIILIVKKLAGKSHEVLSVVESPLFEALLIVSEKTGDELLRSLIFSFISQATVHRACAELMSHNPKFFEFIVSASISIEGDHLLSLLQVIEHVTVTKHGSIQVFNDANLLSILLRSLEDRQHIIVVAKCFSQICRHNFLINHRVLETVLQRLVAVLTDFSNDVDVATAVVTCLWSFSKFTECATFLVRDRAFLSMAPVFLANVDRKSHKLIHSTLSTLRNLLLQPSSPLLTNAEWLVPVLDSVSNVLCTSSIDSLDDEIVVLCITFLTGISENPAIARTLLHSDPLFKMFSMLFERSINYFKTVGELEPDDQNALYIPRILKLFYNLSLLVSAKELDNQRKRLFSNNLIGFYSELLVHTVQILLNDKKPQFDRKFCLIVLHLLTSLMYSISFIAEIVPKFIKISGLYRSLLRVIASLLEDNSSVIAIFRLANLDHNEFTRKTFVILLNLSHNPMTCHQLFQESTVLTFLHQTLEYVEHPNDLTRALPNISSLLLGIFQNIASERNGAARLASPGFFLRLSRFLKSDTGAAVNAAGTMYNIMLHSPETGSTFVQYDECVENIATVLHASKNTPAALIRNVCLLLHSLTTDIRAGYELSTNTMIYSGLIFCCTFFEESVQRLAGETLLRLAEAQSVLGRTKGSSIVNRKQLMSALDVLLNSNDPSIRKSALDHIITLNEM
ncbi:hypothetical protein PCE1_005007 [Barthelona sp. PCE]